MNTDIRISTSFLNHRKRKKLRQILGDRSTDYLIDLWINTALNRPKGILYGMDKTDIAIDAGFEGKADYFVDVLLEVGFLDFDGESFKLHDWDKHQAYAMHADDRSERARIAASKRWGKKMDAVSNANIMPVAYPEHTESNAPSPDPNPNPNPKPDPKKKQPPAFRPLDFLLSLEIKKQIATDFLEVRKKKKSANTKTAFSAIHREIEKTNLTANEVIKICCERGWAGFKASWLDNNKQLVTSSDSLQIEKERRAMGIK